MLLTNLFCFFAAFLYLHFLTGIYHPVMITKNDSTFGECRENRCGRMENTMINITNCGHDSHHRIPCDIEHKDGLPEYLLLIVKTSAWFQIQNRRITTEPNMVILFDKHTYIHYGCPHPDYNDDWIHFTLDEPVDISWFLALDLPLNQPLYPPDIRRLSHLVQSMTREFRFPAGHSRQVLHSLMQSLLHMLTEDLARADQLFYQNKHYPAFLKLRTGLYNNPSQTLSVDDMARSLNLSVSYFQHMYKDFFATSPQTDVIHARLELAKFYLTHSSMSIHALSSFCGYSNEIHFMRQFKKFEGITPSEFRNKMLS